MYVITRSIQLKLRQSKFKVGLWLALKKMIVCLASTKVKKGIHSRTKLARVRLILDVSDLCSKTQCGAPQELLEYSIIV